MVPPPDSTGDEFPDFENMTLEQQMAWLESLAKRQGAKEEEFTTSADLDIPVPENAVIDEPGYVPYSISEGSASKKKDVPASEPAPEPEPVAPKASESVEETFPPVLSDEDYQAAAFEVAADMVDQTEAAGPDLGAMADADSSSLEEAQDPMMWLDSLAAHSEEDLRELAFDLDFDDEDLDELSRELAASDQADSEVPVAAEAEVPEFEPAPEPETIEGFDLEELFAEADQPEDVVEPVVEEPSLSDVDPMRWLESLAARQGANPEELLTSADFDIPELPEDTVVDEPGYVPFDVVAGGPRAKEPEITEPEPVPEEEYISEQTVSETEPELELDLDDLAELVGDEAELLGGADPMNWLESLAKRQGVKDEELTTAADLDVPQPPEDTVVDEPGYVSYSPFGNQPHGDDLAEDESFEEYPVSEPEPAQVEDETPAEFEAMGESLSWLEDLALEPDADMSELLAFEEAALSGDLAVAEEIESDEPESEGVEAGDQPLSDEALAQMSDEEIAILQAQGQLTGEQELAWLQRQAQKLAEARQAEAMAQDELQELPPAEPSEMPDWLRQMRDEAEFEEEEPAGAVLPEESAEADIESAGLPDWLTESVTSEEAEGEVEELSLDSDVESLWAEISEEETPALDLDEMPESELAAFLKGDFVSDEVDQLAEALDLEYERKITGDESEPDWYTEALAKSGAESVSPHEEAASAEEEASEESPLAEATPGEMPDWLAEVSDEVEIIPGEIPDWLTEEVEAEPALEAGEIPDWLQGGEEIPESVTEDWLAELEDEEVPGEAEAVPDLPSEVPSRRAPVSQMEQEIPVEVKTAPIPEGALFEKYRERLEVNPDDFANRLGLARALRTNDQVAASLDQYEVLIDAVQLLEDVSDDLNGLVQDHPGNARMHRLLGDTFMRQGKLQDALEAYRNALDQL